MKFFLLIAACLAAFTTGCQKRVERTERVFQPDESEYVLTIVLDMSSSFQELMAEDGKAWEFVCQVVDKYFRDRIGRSDKLILAQLSASDRALLWRGTPLQLRQEFASASDFRDWLAARTDPNGSLIFDGVAQAVEYTLAEPAVASGKGKSAVFILSDMIDSSPDRDEAQERALKALGELGRKHGVIGLYYVDVRLCSTWRSLLRDAGLPDTHAHVEAEIVGSPALPNFN